MKVVKNVKEIVRIIATVVSVVFVASMCVACSSVEKRCQESVRSEQRELVDKLNANSEFVNFLENTVYNYKKDTFISLDESKKGEIQVKVNGKKKNVDEAQLVQLEEVLKTFNCEKILVRDEGYGKTVNVVLGNVNVDKNNSYVHSIIYSKSETVEEGYGSAIYPNWYHDVFFYT